MDDQTGPNSATEGTKSWDGDEGRRLYYARTNGDIRPHDTLVAALAARDGPPGTALDLGCGTGRDTLHLLASGWRVYALDAEAEALARLAQRVPEEWRSRLTPIVGRFELVNLPTADLVNASYSLPFCPPARFAGFWHEIVAALPPGGLVAGHLFGNRDTWASNPSMTFHTRTEVETLFAGWEVIRCLEQEFEAAPVVGPVKHWHLFQIVARKPSPEGQLLGTEVP